VKLDSDYSGSAPWSKFFGSFPRCEVPLYFSKDSVFYDSFVVHLSAMRFSLFQFCDLYCLYDWCLRDFVADISWSYSTGGNYAPISHTVLGTELHELLTLFERDTHAGPHDPVV